MMMMMMIRDNLTRVQKLTRANLVLHRSQNFSITNFANRILRPMSSK